MPPLFIQPSLPPSPHCRSPQQAVHKPIPAAATTVADCGGAAEPERASECLIKLLVRRAGHDRVAPQLQRGPPQLLAHRRCQPPRPPNLQPPPLPGGVTALRCLLAADPQCAGAHAGAATRAAAALPPGRAAVPAAVRAAPLLPLRREQQGEPIPAAPSRGTAMSTRSS